MNNQKQKEQKNQTIFPVDIVSHFKDIYLQSKNQTHLYQELFPGEAFLII
jgi:hypothetical protein